MTGWSIIADLVAIVHAAIVAFVVLGFAAIFAGAALGWGWTRGFRIRAAHLGLIVFVMLEAILGLACPLTTLENALRMRAGEGGYPRDFIGYWIDRLIFYAWPPWVFIALYAGVAVLAAVSWKMWPPKR